MGDARGFVRRNGITKANNFSTYIIPTSVDIPDIETIILESGGGFGPYGAKAEWVNRLINFDVRRNY